MTGGKTATDAIGMDIWCPPLKKWLRYYQQPRGRGHVEQSGLTDNFADIDIQPPIQDFKPRIRINDAGQQYGEFEPGVWKDTTGELHNPEIHATASNGNASYKANGEFRARRGAMQMTTKDLLEQVDNTGQPLYLERVEVIQDRAWHGDPAATELLRRAREGDHIAQYYCRRSR